MQFTWVDYPDQYEAELENWCDETVRHALDGDSIKKEYEYYANAKHHTLNKDYFCKVVLEGKIAVALVMLVMRKTNAKHTSQIPLFT